MQGRVLKRKSKKENDYNANYELKFGEFKFKAQ